MLLVQPVLAPSANPLGLKGPSRARWSMQPRCRLIGLTLRATVTGERVTFEGLAERTHDIAGEAEESDRRQQDESKGAVPSEEGDKRGAVSLRGIKRGTEVVARMVTSKRRNRGPHSEETKEKMRQAHLNKRHTLVARLKISKSKTGMRHSEETKRKMSVARKQYWDNWHQERMSLQPTEPSKVAEDLKTESLEEPQVRVPESKRKAWYRQNKESKAGEQSCRGVKQSSDSAF